MPVLDGVVPSAGDPDDRFTVVLVGDVFTRVTQVSFGPGIRIEFFAVLGDGIIEVKIRIDEGAIAGPRDITLTDPSGPEIFPGRFRVR